MYNYFLPQTTIVKILILRLQYLRGNLEGKFPSFSYIPQTDCKILKFQAHCFNWLPEDSILSKTYCTHSCG